MFSPTNNGTSHIRLFDIGTNGRGSQIHLQWQKNGNWGGAKVVTDEVTATVFYVKKNQLETSMMIDDNNDVMMETKDGDGNVGKLSIKKDQQAGDKDQLTLPCSTKK